MKVARGAIALTPACLATEMHRRGCSARMLVRGSEMGKGPLGSRHDGESSGIGYAVGQGAGQACFVHQQGWTSPMAGGEEAECSPQQPLEAPTSPHQPLESPAAPPTTPAAPAAPSSCSGERPGPTQVCSSLRAHGCLLGCGFGKGKGVVPCRG